MSACMLLPLPQVQYGYSLITLDSFCVEFIKKLLYSVDDACLQLFILFHPISQLSPVMAKDLFFAPFGGKN